MHVPEVVSIATTALQKNRLRSFLTLLGVIIGVMTIVAVVAVIQGLNNYVATQLFQLRPDVYIATQFGIITSREEFLEALKRKRIDRDDAAAVERLCSSCAQVGVSVNGNMVVKYKARRLADVAVNGGTANMDQLTSVDLEDGRFFTANEELHSAQVTVIGWDVKDEMFGQLDPIGRVVRVDGKPLRVIGTMRKQGSVLGQSQDKQIYVPLRTYEKLYGTRRSLALFIKPVGGIPAMKVSEDEVRTILRSRRNTPFSAKDPFSFVTGEALQNVWKNISGGAFALMIFISGISLGVGGIVITNIMLVSVVERTREIGIRRALGARKRDIMLQFLTEAVMLSGGGGVAGILLGAAIAYGIEAAFPLPTAVTPGLLVTGILVSLVTGVVAGFLPARKAAGLPPIEALRYE
ncbi:MAG: ABC transporter permease [Acidobacteria bacterium]|nr:ABC transporter permease [Acidobacteriota bacterium]